MGALREYDPARLPVVVESWTPYRATVTAPEPAWLETPRMFTAGYRATVNGRSAAVARSPDGLAMLPVPAGESRVQLTYPGPIALRLAYYLSLVTWTAVIGFGLRQFFRSRQPPAV